MAVLAEDTLLPPSSGNHNINGGPLRRRPGYPIVSRL